MLPAAGPQDSDLPPAVINGLFEALSYGEMLDDAGTAAALEAAVLHLAPKLDLDLASGGRYPGLYQLMAHRSPEMRSLVGPHIKRIEGLGPTVAGAFLFHHLARLATGMTLGGCIPGACSSGQRQLCWVAQPGGTWYVECSKVCR